MFSFSGFERDILPLIIPGSFHMDRLCTRCIGDDDLKAWVRSQSGRRGCDFCGTAVAPTATLDDFCEHLEACISRYWGSPEDQMSYCSQEGGWLGSTYDTEELIFDYCDLDLPLDHSGALADAIRWSLSDQLWCDYDWLSLDEDRAMILGWDRFCKVIKHERRYFFHRIGEDPDDRDSYSPMALLAAIAHFSSTHGLIRELPVGTKLYRARPYFSMRNPPASQFGPPPRDSCQNNRMNPAGVPMFYGSLDPNTTVREIKSDHARVGRFISEKSLRILDLTQLPPTPSYFSPKERKSSMELSFMNHFARTIMLPVDREDRAHVDYLPSQVVTEYLRDHNFKGGKLDGILYGSVASPGKRNIVLFIESLEPSAPPFSPPPAPSLTFLGARTVRLP